VSKAESGNLKFGNAKSGIRKHRDGFSLVEVSLAIFVIAVGFLTLFSLFPAGLKQGEAGHADTQTALFGAFVMEGMRANATDINAEDWDDVSSMEGNSSPLLANIWIGGVGNVPISTFENAIEYPGGSGLHMRHLLEIDYNANRDLYAVSLWIAAGQYGSQDADIFKLSATKFYTELFYSGMP
jgi:prepilin-type N-terminal cleavage/methylation domain-containing protein